MADEHGSSRRTTKYNGILSLLASWVALPKAAGVMQTPKTTFDMNQAAATYTLFTGTVQDGWLEAIIVRFTGGAMAAPFTYFTVQINDTTVQTLISQVDGAVGNCTDQNQISWQGAEMVKAGKLVTITIAVAAAGAARVCDVVAKYRAITGGGYLAP